MRLLKCNASESLGITKCNTTMKELATAKPHKVSAGELLKIIRLASFGECLVRIYSCEKKTLILSSSTYACDYSVFKVLHELLCSMLLSIPHRDKRLMICSNSDSETFLLHLKLNDMVKVNRTVMDRNEDVVCIVKYIGAVPQIGPGTYIGFVLFDENDSVEEKNNLARQYFTCNTRNGFIRNCGCFFTRTFLLDQNSDKLLELVRRSQSHRAKQIESHPTKPIETKNIELCSSKQNGKTFNYTNRVVKPSAPTPTLEESNHRCGFTFELNRIRSENLVRNSESVTVRHSIRLDPRSSKRTIIEEKEKVKFHYTGEKRKKRCTIM